MARFPFVNYFMAWGIRLVVPKQRIGAGLVALDEEDRVLLLRHVFHPYTPWGIPGGWLNRHEAPADGVLRELKEETGLTAVLTQHPTHRKSEQSASHRHRLSGPHSTRPPILKRRNHRSRLVFRRSTSRAINAPEPTSD